MLYNIISYIAFDTTNIASLMNIEILQSYVNVVPDNGYAITDLTVLLGLLYFRTGVLCVAQVVEGGYINGMLIDGVLHTLDPNLISILCSIFL